MKVIILPERPLAGVLTRAVVEVTAGGDEHHLRV
jgi:hypothetical protein